MIRTLFRQFACEETGAITVDWVVLTAATCLLGALFVFQIKGPQDAIGEEIENSLSSGTLSAVEF